MAKPAGPFFCTADSACGHSSLLPGPRVGSGSRHTWQRGPGPIHHRHMNKASCHRIATECYRSACARLSPTGAVRRPGFRFKPPEAGPTVVHPWWRLSALRNPPIAHSLARQKKPRRSGALNLVMRRSSARNVLSATQWEGAGTFEISNAFLPALALGSSISLRRELWSVHWA
jgi:hypothetical protein